MLNNSLEIYDATLREGEQSARVSFSKEDRIKLFKLLDDFGMHYIELGWPVVSKEIKDSFKDCLEIAKNSEVVAFGSTSFKENVEEDDNLKAIVETGVRYACIFGKTWDVHIEKQLNITKQKNLGKIKQSIGFLKDKGLEVFYDAEHFFDGFKSDSDYALQTLKAAGEAGAKRVVLCDTNGGLMPDEAKEIVKKVRDFFDEKKLSSEIGVHFHDDCGLALANTLNSLEYVKQVQGTINGTGERIGNLDFSEFIPIYIKKIGKEIKGIDVKKIKDINDLAYLVSGNEIPENKPFVGRTAFLHKGGVHVDATKKGASYEQANPEDFGNKRIILLNTLGGASAVENVAKEFGYEIDKKDPETKEKIKDLFKELRYSEIKGYKLGDIRAEQFLLIKKYFEKLEEVIKIKNWNIQTGFSEGDEKSIFYAKGIVCGKEFEDIEMVKGGPVNAIYKLMQKVLLNEYPEIKKLRLLDFHVEIANRNKEESSVRTVITFENHEIFRTVGVDRNIIASAMEALEKGFRYFINKKTL